MMMMDGKRVLWVGVVSLVGLVSMAHAAPDLQGNSDPTKYDGTVDIYTITPPSITTWAGVPLYQVFSSTLIEREMTITFDTPVTGFGGYWNVDIPLGSGPGLDVTILGDTIEVHPDPGNQGFWGVISTVPFTQAVISVGSGSNPFTFGKFTFTGLVYSTPIPAPGALILAGLGTCLVGWIRTRIRF